MDKKQVFKEYEEKASQVMAKQSRIKSLLLETGDKLKDVIQNHQSLHEFSGKVFTLLRMLKSQFSGAYNAFPMKTLLLIGGALIYFVTPFDIIPDFIPFLGLTDDITIVYWIFNTIKEDITQFENWENTIDIEVSDES